MRVARCKPWRHATQPVGGVGDLMLVGEQPGNVEDLAGTPFVGAASATGAFDDADLELARVISVVARELGDIDRRGSPADGQVSFGLDRCDDTKLPAAQCGQRAVTMCETRGRNAATDSISAGCGDGAPSAARAAARCVRLCAGASRP